MAGSKSTLTAARLRELLHYDPETGVFTRLTRSAQSVRVGDVAGSVSKNGYRHISVGGKQYYAHRLAVLYMTGAWPENDVDHRDSDRLNNRWGNLRRACRDINQQNLRRAQKNNQSGFLGVSWHKKLGRWRAQIRVDGKHQTLGFFDDPAVAHAAYVEAKRRLHPGCTI